MYRLQSDVHFGYIAMSRTIALSDDVAAIVSQYAQSRGFSLSEAIAPLILHSTHKSPRIKHVDGLPVFDDRSDA